MSAGAVARWWFADRRTGRITIVQAPNALALVATTAAAGGALPGRAGHVARAVRVVVVLAWGLDEAARGVNPWRRTLGGVALWSQARRLLT
jgi:hypothetical protein